MSEEVVRGTSNKKDQEINNIPWSCDNHRLNILAPNKIAMTNNARNKKNNTFAISAAPSAIPPKPKTAAIIAIIKKITDQRNIVHLFNLYILTPKGN